MFCNTFGDGYVERKTMMAYIYDITDYDTFITNCTNYYTYIYDSDTSMFDAIDMLGSADSDTICESLYDMVEVLILNNKNTLSEVVRYSYLYSIEYFILSAESTAYTGCYETEAEESTFCLSYYDWDTTFSLWSSTEDLMVCAKIATALSSTTTTDTCAYYTSRVYQAYYYFLTMILDTMVSSKMSSLTTELTTALLEA